MCQQCVIASDRDIASAGRRRPRHTACFTHQQRVVCATRSDGILVDRKESPTAIRMQRNVGGIAVCCFMIYSSEAPFLVYRFVRLPIRQRIRLPSIDNEPPAPVWRNTQHIRQFISVMAGAENAWRVKASPAYSLDD